MTVVVWRNKKKYLQLSTTYIIVFDCKHTTVLIKENSLVSRWKIDSDFEITTRPLTSVSFSTAFKGKVNFMAGGFLLFICICLYWSFSSLKSWPDISQFSILKISRWTTNFMLHRNADELTSRFLKCEMFGRDKAFTTVHLPPTPLYSFGHRSITIIAAAAATATAALWWID